MKIEDVDIAFFFSSLSHCLFHLFYRSKSIASKKKSNSSGLCVDTWKRNFSWTKKKLEVSQIVEERLFHHRNIKIGGPHRAYCQHQGNKG